MKQVCALVSMLLLALHVSIGAFGQTLMAHTASKSASPQQPPKIVGYLAREEPNFLDMLPPYPVIDSKQDEIDVATLRQWQQLDDSPRWRLANEDVRMSYDRFAQAFGTKITQAETPFLVHLLNRVEQDVQTVAFSAKDFYNRSRPYQRFQMERVCGAEKAPPPEVPLKGGSSYPSGHTSFGWSTGLILAEVAPERAQPLLARGREYGESRIVCAVHYPSDIVGGQLVATAVVARLHANEEFEKDLACAKEEHSVLLHPTEALSRACRQRKAQLDQAQAPAPIVQSLPVGAWRGCTGNADDLSSPCAMSP